MGAKDISTLSLVILSGLLVVPLLLCVYLRLDIINRALVSLFRMTVQLLFIGFFLGYLFELNNPFLNVSWFIVMILSATLATLKNSSLSVRILFMPVFLSITVATIAVVLYFNGPVISTGNLFDAKYLIAIGGMLLGNTMKGNIVGLTAFYNSLKNDEQGYIFRLCCGGTRFEALLPAIRESMTASLSPTIATMATMGIVSLPGMMTGQILGGSSPMVSVKYQIAIMAAIFSTCTITTFLAILFSLRYGFDRAGRLNRKIYV